LRIEGAESLIRKLKALPKAQRDKIARAQLRSANEAKRVLQVMIPRKSGELADSVEVVVEDGGLRVAVEVGEDNRDSKIQAYTLEGGRDAGTRGGHMEAQPYAQPTRQYLGKKHKARLKRAVRQAIKETGQNG
jgi:hypothetical protein